MKNESVQLVKEGATAGGTISVGTLTLLQIIPPLLGCLATILGMAFTIILMRNAAESRNYKKMINEAILEDIKYRRENNLPPRINND